MRTRYRDAKLAENPFPHLNNGLPPGTSAAQVRLVCTYAKSPTDWALRTTAERVGGYKSGDPRKDVELFWWAASGTTTELLRWVLELSGPPGARAGLAEVALAEGLVDASTRDFLAAELPRPAWADGDVQWEVDEIVEAGSVALPDGRLSAADPYWAFEGVRFEIELPPGAYPVRVFKAIHPLLGRQCAAADVVVAPELELARWERVGVHRVAPAGVRLPRRGGRGRLRRGRGAHESLLPRARSRRLHGQPRRARRRRRR